MRTPLTFAFFAAVIVALATAHAAAWQTHKYETDGFAVDFSGTVQVKPTDLNEETMSSMSRSTSYLQDGGDVYAYLIGASLMKDGVNFDFEAGVKGTIDTYKCTRIESDTSAKQADGKSREIHGAKCNGGDIRVGARFFHRGRWFYQVVYLIAPNANAADAERFLASFKLLPPA